MSATRAQLAALGLALAVAFPAASAGAERIRSFHVDVELAADGTFLVTEHIVYDFESAQRRGIYRDVPVRYGRGRAADYRISLDVVSVNDDRGAERPYAESSQGVYRRIRIGRRDRTVTGAQAYRIAYRVRRGILWFEDHDELYWNATGNEWKVPIDRASATVFLADGLARSPLRAICFTGPQGSVETACDTEEGDGRARFAATRGLGPGEGLTLVVAIPKGTLAEPSRLARFLDRVSDYVSWATALPLAALLGMGGFWWRAGRDPRGPVAIPVRYEPPDGMTPAEMGTVLDEKVDMRDITATILDLAVRGYLRIEELSTTSFLFLSTTDYVLERVKPEDESLKEHERELLDALLGSAQQVKVSELKNSFYKHLPDLRRALYREVTRRGKWFPIAPDHVRNGWTALGIAVALLGAVVFAIAERPAFAVAVAASGAIVAGFGRHMPRKTRAGRRASQEIRGFQEFIERVEVDRLRRLGLHDTAHFEKVLPYAFVLGAADAWADAFADLYTEPPDWYHSRRGGRFHSRDFVSDLGRSLDTCGHAMRSQPRSSGSGSSGFGGGGFSGGGFGGGGGGSW